jgi:hypothetical protein
MPRIYPEADTGDWKITMYFGDHNPPHFHIVTPDEEALVEIATLEIIEGRVPRAVLKPALEWARENKALLLAKWEAFQIL